MGLNALETNRADTDGIKIQKHVWRCRGEMLGKLKTWLKSDGTAAGASLLVTPQEFQASSSGVEPHNQALVLGAWRWGP